MKNKYIILLAFVIFTAGGCNKDDFAELNSKPDAISEAEISYSMTKAIEQMYSDDYTLWFYNNFAYVFPWSQVCSVQGGNGGEFVVMGATGGHNLYSGMFPQTRDIRYQIDGMSEEQKIAHQAIKAMSYVVQIQPAITVTDNTGSLVYSEAGLAPYTNPPVFTPAIDNQQKLFTLWLEELNFAIAAFKQSNQVLLGKQDFIYGGDYSKWVKFSNLLKLKIAARLVNKDRAQALAIAAEVGASEYMDDLSDDFIYHRGIKYYGTGNGLWIGYGNKQVVDFMIANQDPRLRFIFEKNGFNSEVVQAFIDAGKALPPYVAQYVNLDGSGNFASWKSPGEPWVRYHGIPLSPDDRLKPENDIYFNQGTLYKIKLNEVEKSYSATSLYSEKLVRTSYDYTYPTKPGGRVIQLKDNDPGLNVILGSAAETNLYLAEFKLLGASLPKSAQEYFNRGVELSILRMDALAKSNQMPYYDGDPVYTNPDQAAAAATKLRSNEISDLLTKPSYDLTTDGLEKVYIQQYINFMNTPGDIWTTVRRSGVPKVGSTILPYVQFLSGGVPLSVPRRFTVSTPTADDLNYTNKLNSITEQGFTSGTVDPGVLNAERLWFDKENPQYGAGPK